MGSGRRSAHPVVVALITILAGRSYAGLLDSPVPTLGNGNSARVIYRMGPVYYDPGWVDTVVTCTNLTGTVVEAALEIFDEHDAAQGGVTRAALGPNASVTFATSANAGVDTAIVVTGLAAITHGKARVSASSAEITCTAHGRYRADDGSVKESPLGLVKKVAFGNP